MLPFLVYAIPVGIVGLLGWSTKAITEKGIEEDAGMQPPRAYPAPAAPPDPRQSWTPSDVQTAAVQRHRDWAASAIPDPQPTARWFDFATGMSEWNDVWNGAGEAAKNPPKKPNDDLLIAAMVVGGLSLLALKR